MSGKTSIITLGTENYKIHAFNVGELRRIAKIIGSDTDGADKGFEIVKMSLARAEPSVDSDAFELLEPEFDQITVASNVILELAGLKANANPPVGAIPAA